MDVRHPLSRRRFFGGVAAAMGVLGLRPSSSLFAQGQTAQFRGSDAEYDAYAKLASNENNWGPPESVMKAMNNSWKYANRYGYPDGNVVQAIADHHGVKPENILLTAGSGEVLQVMGTTFLQDRPEGARRRPVLRLGLSARDQHQGRGDQAAAAQGLPAERAGDDRGGQSQRPRHRLLLPLQPQQPHRRDRHREGSEADPRRHPEGHAGADRRGLSPLRGRPGLRHLDALRARGTPGGRGPHVLEDRGAGGDAHRLCRGAGRHHPADASLLDEQRQRAGEVGRGGVAQGHAGAGRREGEDHRRCATRPPPNSRRGATR